MAHTAGAAPLLTGTGWPALTAALLTHAVAGGANEVEARVRSAMPAAAHAALLAQLRAAAKASPCPWVAHEDAVDTVTAYPVPRARPEHVASVRRVCREGASAAPSDPREDDPATAAEPAAAAAGAPEPTLTVHWERKARLWKGALPGMPHMNVAIARESPVEAEEGRRLAEAAAAAEAAATGAGTAAWRRPRVRHRQRWSATLADGVRYDVTRVTAHPGPDQGPGAAPTHLHEVEVEWVGPPPTDEASAAALAATLLRHALLLDGAAAQCEAACRDEGAAPSPP